MPSHIRKLLAIVCIGLATLAAPASALAQDAIVEAARAQGLVGEMYTGYLGVVDASRASADLRRRVEETNARRLAAYTQTAEKTGQSVATIAALTAEKVIQRVPSGEVVLPGAGETWVRKP